jgi:hypothetical protein
MKMIRKSVLKARAARGYAWLQRKGQYYGLDVNRLHLRPELINVADPDWCPLAHADAEPMPLRGYPDGHFEAIVERLDAGRPVRGTGKFIRVHDIEATIECYGFDIVNEDATWLDGRRWFGTWGFAPGSERDWRLLTEAWREVIAANKPAVVKEEVSK